MLGTTFRGQHVRRPQAPRRDGDDDTYRIIALERGQLTQPHCGHRECRVSVRVALRTSCCARPSTALAQLRPACAAEVRGVAEAVAALEIARFRDAQLHAAEVGAALELARAKGEIGDELAPLVVLLRDQEVEVVERTDGIARPAAVSTGTGAANVRRSARALSLRKLRFPKSL